MSRLVVSDRARRDLHDIGDYIARDNPRRALAFLRELRDQFARIGRWPKAYRSRTEIGPGIRSCAFGNYVIFFVEMQSVIRIVRVLHGAMDIEDQFAEGIAPEGPEVDEPDPV